MYVVVETDRYGTLEIATFDTVNEAEVLIRKLAHGMPHRYVIAVKSPVSLCTY